MKHKKILIILIQMLLLFSFIYLWEYLSSNEYINTFIYSSPSKIIKCIKDLYLQNNLFIHIYITLKEIIVSFMLSIFISLIIAILFYIFPFIYKIFEPFLTVINSVPKVAIGPLIIIIFGACSQSIIIMALSITLIVNILNIYNGLTSTDSYLIKYLDSLNASTKQKILYLVIPSAIKSLISTLKINISLTLIGVIMGEFLVSKAGIGYLIIYGTQVFNLTLVMSGIFILLIISYLFYLVISIVEKLLTNY